MDWLKAIMIFTMIGFGAALVYVCATLESLVNENGNLKAQIETLKNGHTETKKAIMDTSDRLDAAVDDINSGFERTLGIYDSVLDLWNKFNSRLNVIEYSMEDRAKESSEFFKAVQNDINEIRGDLMALKANCSELCAGTDAHIEPFITDESPEFDRSFRRSNWIGDSSEHSRCAVEEENSTDLEVEMADQK